MRRAPLAVERGLALLVQACHALQVVHERGVIHRDINLTTSSSPTTVCSRSWISALPSATAPAAGSPARA